MCKGLKILHLTLFKAFDGIGIHLDDGSGAERTTSNARTGNEMRPGRQTLRFEILATGPYKAQVVGVDIANKEPGAHAISCQRHSAVSKHRFVALEDFRCL